MPSHGPTNEAMQVALEESPVSYEELADIERDFDEVETEIIKQQVTLSAPLYAARTKLISQISNFWPLVFEQAPPDIDQWIQPTDSNLLLTALTSFSVERFEIDVDPRSVLIRFEFAPNDYLVNEVLEKRFWWRCARNGWSGLVSEPVNLKWKAGKDLTSGLLRLVSEAWEAEQVAAEKHNGVARKRPELLPEHKALQEKIDTMAMGGVSFFGWFGFIGRRISAEESAAVKKNEKAKRQARMEGTTPPDPLFIQDEEEDSGYDSLEEPLEIFPDGDDLAISMSEDLWPGAIKYFTQAQENDALSDEEFESDDEQTPESDDEPPAKKKRTT